MLEVFHVQSAIVPSVWLRELLYRLKFEIMICGGEQSDASNFLWKEIVKELYFHLNRDEKLFNDQTYFLPTDELLEKINRYIEANLANPPTAEELAKFLSMSQSTLRRYVKNKLSVTVAQYIRQRRLEKAYYYLLYGTNDIHEISLKVGYQDFSSFSAAFKAQYGYSPSKVKKIK